MRFIETPGMLKNYPMYDINQGDNRIPIPLYENLWKVIPFSRLVGEYLSTSNDDHVARYLCELVAFTKDNCPTLAEVISDLESLDLIANCFISKLTPGSIIHPHTGRTQKFMRLHMGLDCDPDCTITVGQQQRVWENGKFLAFKDGGPYLHSVQHKGTKQRIIISCDLDLAYLKSIVPRLKEFD